MRRLSIVLLAILLLMVTVGLSWGAEKKVKIGMVYDIGSKADKSFNEAAWRGLTQAGKDFGIITTEIEPGQDIDREAGMRMLASQGYDLVIGVGFLFTEAMKAAAKDYPNVKFAIVDGYIPDIPNVASLLFTEEQGSYLVGIIAGLATKTNKIGFVGGMDIPLIHKFEAGFRAGVKSVNPKAVIYSDYAGVTPQAFADPVKGKELALAQFNKGCDIIYHASGHTGLGVIEAAKEKKKFAIGVDSNQNYLAPGYVLTSMLKRVDVAIYKTIESVVKGTFKGGINVFDLKAEGVGWALDEYNKRLITKKIMEAVEKARKDIIEGQIVVPTK